MFFWMCISKLGLSMCLKCLCSILFVLLKLFWLKMLNMMIMILYLVWRFGRVLLRSVILWWCRRNCVWLWLMCRWVVWLWKWFGLFWIYLFWLSRCGVGVMIGWLVMIWFLGCCWSLFVWMLWECVNWLMCLFI